MWALAARVLTPLDTGELRFLEDGVVVVDARGTIAEVTRRDAVQFEGPLLDLHPCVVMPGFVDAHVHYPQTRIIGRATGPLLDWLRESVYPEEARFLDVIYAREVAGTLVDRMLAVGTTSAAIFSSSSEAATEVLFETLAERGLRALVGLTLMNRQAPESLMVKRKEALRASERLVARWHEHDDGRLRFAVTPRFALSCTKALLRDAGRLAASQGLAIQTHIAENAVECAAAVAAHPYARDYLEIYEQAGLVGDRTILAHAVRLSRSEWRRVRDARASVAHCPDSNFFLGSGRMSLRKAHGVTTALGSDVAAGRSFSLRRAMASAYDNALCENNGVSLERLFCMATLDGARALGWGERTGSLEPGKDADLVALRLPAHARSRDELLAAILFDNDESGVEASWVRGRRLDHLPVAAHAKGH
jgi:guanine deaminase